MLDRFVKQGSNGSREAALSVAGITCSGCIAGIESKFRRYPGIQSIQVNPSTHRASVIWDGEALSFEQVIRLFSDMGYPAVPHQASR